MAVIGEEGDGKSTLLKAIYDLSLVSYALVEGKIIKKGFVSYLSQGLKQLDISVYDFLFLSLEDYYQKINDLYKYLLLIELSEDILEKNLTILSGGEKVKIQILKLLLENPEVLLLDEPTNDLDLKTIKWLESFINKIDIPVLYVSHDEELLENTANRILHIEQLNKKSEPKVTVVSLGYRQYVAERLHLIKRNITISNKEKKVLERQKDKLMEVTNSVEFYQNTISRSDPFTAASLKRKMKSLKVQERRLEKKEILEVPEYEEGIKLFFEEIKINPKKEIIDLKLDKLLIGKTELVSNLSLYVKGNEHIVIIGKNGVGKTTLLKNIYKTLLNKKELIIGYMPQDYQEIIDDDLTPLQFLSNSLEKDILTRNRIFLSSLKFTQEEILNKIKYLSLGSQAKLILLKLTLDKCNVLILDELTRNISPLSNPIIRDLLKAYQGTIISVSHDRKYIKEIGESVYELKRDGLFKIELD